MINKNAVLHTVQTLPDSASWTEIVDALLKLAATNGSVSEYAQLYRSQLTAADLAEYANLQCDISLDEVIKELEQRHAVGSDQFFGTDQVG